MRPSRWMPRRTSSGSGAQRMRSGSGALPFFPRPAARLWHRNGRVRAISMSSVTAFLARSHLVNGSAHPSGSPSGDVDEDPVVAARSIGRRARSPRPSGRRRSGPSPGPRCCGGRGRGPRDVHWTQVAFEIGWLIGAGCHGPSSIRTSTPATPRSGAQATPATTIGPAATWAPAAAGRSATGSGSARPWPSRAAPSSRRPPRGSSARSTGATWSPTRSRTGPGRSAGPGSRGWPAAARGSSRPRPSPRARAPSPRRSGSRP